MAKKTTSKKTTAAKNSKKTTAAKKAAAKKEVAWSDHRKRIVKAMQVLKATKSSAAIPADKIAKKAGGEVTPELVKHYCYKNQQLVQLGYVAIAQHEDVRTLVYYLTAKGAKVNTAQVGKKK